MRGGIQSIVALVALLAVSSAAGKQDETARRPSPGPTAQGGFTDQLDAPDATRWSEADGWTNGSPFDNAWSADNVGFRGGQLLIRLDDVARLGEPYSSGEYRTDGYYGYGCYEASFRPVARAGVVTAFFTFAGPYDNGGNGRHNEIDIEFVGADARQVQFNFWTNDDAYSARNEYLHDLGTDASARFERYGFKWTASGIEWYVGGQRVYSVADSDVSPTPKAGESLQKIMMNLWPVDATAEEWAGRFAYSGYPLEAPYEWVRYIAGEDCDLTQPPEIPEPPPTLPEEALYVADIALGLNAKRTQVVARVSVRDGLGQPAGDVRVSGAWSGLITGGDTARDTDASGVATFYSSRSSARGTVQFCTTSLSRGGSYYEPAANVEVCDSIAK